jgi:hypothetical protein
MDSFCSALIQKNERRLFLIISSTIARPTPAPSNPALVAAGGELPPNGLDAPIESKAEDLEPTVEDALDSLNPDEAKSSEGLPPARGGSLPAKSKI